MIKLPDVEKVAEQVHIAWMQSKKAQGLHTRKLEDGEELMMPYEQLSGETKDLDRNTVKAVYSSINNLKG